MLTNPEKNSSKFITLLCLYIAQSVPLSFFTTVVPVIMRQEQYSLESIGLLQLVKLPWIVKFLWAPFVDKTAVNTRGYIRWIVYSELFYAIIVFAVGFLSLQTNFYLIISLVIVAITASATQDIATDAMAILCLKKRERSIGNSMQSAGGFIGALLGSGVLLLVYSYFGWKFLLIGLALFVLVALIPLLFFSKSIVVNTNCSGRSQGIRFFDIYRFFVQKGIGKQIILLILFYSSIIGILTMLKPYLVDLGYGIKQIGFMSGIVGTAIAAISAFFAGWLLRIIGLKSGIILFSVLMFFVAFYFWQISSNSYNTLAFLYTGVILLWGIYGMATVVIYTTSMNYVRKGCEGTDFTIQTVLAHLGSLIFAVLSGQLAAKFTYSGLFIIEMILAIVTIVYVIFFYTKNNDNLING